MAITAMTLIWIAAALIAYQAAGYIPHDARLDKPLPPLEPAITRNHWETTDKLPRQR